MVLVTSHLYYKKFFICLNTNKNNTIEDITENIKYLGFLWFKNRFKCRLISWSNWCNFVFM